MKIENCSCGGIGNMIFSKKGLIVDDGFDGIKCNKCGKRIKEISQHRTIRKWNELNKTGGEK